MARERKEKSERSLALPLARIGDPYVTHDGTKVYPESPTKEVDKTQPKVSASSFRPNKKRTIKELPAPVNVINGVACVLLYTILGVGDREMADALKVKVSEVKDIRKHIAYDDCFNAVVSEFINVNSDLVHARIAAYGHNAVTNIMEIANNGKQESNKLRANIDMADRGGFTKKDNSLRMGMGDALRIVVTDGDKKLEVNIGEMSPS